MTHELNCVYKVVFLTQGSDKWRVTVWPTRSLAWKWRCCQSRSCMWFPRQLLPELSWAIGFLGWPTAALAYGDGQFWGPCGAGAGLSSWKVSPFVLLFFSLGPILKQTKKSCLKTFKTTVMTVMTVTINRMGKSTTEHAWRTAGVAKTQRIQHGGSMLQHLQHVKLLSIGCLCVLEFPNSPWK